jgi:hypothetical protein
MPFIDINTLSSVIGVSAIVSAGVNYFIRWIESRHMRTQQLVESRLRIYSYFLFHLEILSHSIQILARNSKDNDSAKLKAEKTLELINREVGDRWYLLSSGIMEQWVAINKLYPKIDNGWMNIHDRINQLKVDSAQEYEGIKVNYQKFLGKSSEYLDLNIAKWLQSQA